MNKVIVGNKEYILEDKDIALIEVLKELTVVIGKVGR